MEFSRGEFRCSIRGAPSNSTGKIVTIVVAVIALLAVVAGGAWYVINQNSTSDEDPQFFSVVSTTASLAEEETTEETSEPEETNKETTTVKAELAPEERCWKDVNDPSAGPGDQVSVICDGHWMVGTDYGTSGTALYTWSDGDWERIDSDSSEGAGNNFPCYTDTYLDSLGVPVAIRESTECSDNTSNQHRASTSAKPASGLTPLSCGGGQYILIVESVLVYPGEDANAAVNAALARHPGAQAAAPGACPSLRGEVDGAQVYPVFIDYGSDRAGVCAVHDPTQRNAYARELKTTVDDYASPC